MAFARILVALAVVFTVRCSWAEAPPAPPPPSAKQRLLAEAQRVLRDTHVPGCYEHVPPERSGPQFRHAAPWQPPERFYLSTDFTTDPPGDGAKVMRADSYRASGTWRRLDDNTIEVSWSTDFAGVRVTLRRSSTDGLWRGRTQPFSDDGLAPPGTEISVRRVSDVPCEQKPL
jgi:hypothetical protein